MSELTIAAEAALELPEVQRAMRQLATFGLGVFLPHLHTDSEGFAKLPDDMVSVERNLRTTFMPREQADTLDAQAVGWVWNEGVETTMMCQLDMFTGQCA